MPHQVVGTVEAVAKSGSGFRLRGIAGWFNLGPSLEPGSLRAGELTPGMEVAVLYTETGTGRRFVRKVALPGNGHEPTVPGGPARPELGVLAGEVALPARADAKATGASLDRGAGSAGQGDPGLGARWRPRDLRDGRRHRGGGRGPGRALIPHRPGPQDLLARPVPPGAVSFARRKPRLVRGPKKAVGTAVSCWRCLRGSNAVSERYPPRQNLDSIRRAPVAVSRDARRRSDCSTGSRYVPPRLASCDDVSSDACSACARRMTPAASSAAIASAE